MNPPLKRFSSLCQRTGYYHCNANFGIFYSNSTNFAHFLLFFTFFVSKIISFIKFLILCFRSGVICAENRYHDDAEIVAAVEEFKGLMLYIFFKNYAFIAILHDFLFLLRFFCAAFEWWCLWSPKWRRGCTKPTVVSLLQLLRPRLSSARQMFCQNEALGGASAGVARPFSDTCTVW